MSKYFTDDEIACKCGCGFDTMDPRTLAIADDVREFVGKPIVPSSGCRCAAHNKKVGGADNSMHVQGKAMDLPVDNPHEVFEYLVNKYPGKYGFGLYKTFVHVDCRESPARWMKAQ